MEPPNAAAQTLDDRITVRLGAEHLAQVRALARELGGISPSDVLRMAVADFIRAHRRRPA